MPQPLASADQGPSCDLHQGLDFHFAPLSSKMQLKLFRVLTSQQAQVAAFSSSHVMWQSSVSFPPKHKDISHQGVSDDIRPRERPTSSPVQIQAGRFSAPSFPSCSTVPSVRSFERNCVSAGLATCSESVDSIFQTCSRWCCSLDTPRALIRVFLHLTFFLHFSSDFLLCCDTFFPLSVETATILSWETGRN